MSCLDSLAECEVLFIDQDLEINRDESEREIIVVATYGAEIVLVEPGPLTGKSRRTELFLGVNLIWTANNRIKEYHLELPQSTYLELWKWTRTQDDWVSLADAP
ncbi:hypothetical protein HO173_012216 [Letharia columbiana]|uniref:Uncharacterized protein n=1 Tax=Letharia columbiana TaxID=112416 RepID=A0A8H6CQ62_9LECA|nr:uncharacterized protein HO173_012216 [Letharia columbiana]KAF6227577.1 hypothetical protein HO173_012216 [Letharia columbiana]